MNEVEAVARAICATRGLSPDALYQHHEWEPWPIDRRDEYVGLGGEVRINLMHYAWRHHTERAQAAIAALDAARGDQVARVEALSDNGELLTIAWMDGSHSSNTAHRARIAELEAEVAWLRTPQWYYHPDYTETCQVCPWDVIEYYDLEPGKHIVEIQTARPLPSIWSVVHVLTDDEKDAMGTDDEWLTQDFTTEDEARTALGASHDADA